MPDSPVAISQNEKSQHDSQGFTPFLRRLPHSVDAEMALLGAIILDNRILRSVVEFLKPEHFILDEHSRIYKACMQQIDAGLVADPVTMQHFFETDASITSAGGVEYLVRLSACAATCINAKQYAYTISEQWKLRQLISTGEGITNAAYAAKIGEPAETIVDDAMTSLYALSEGTPENGFVQAGNLVEDVFAQAQTALQRRKDGLPNGLMTGFESLDRIIGGLQNGDLVYLAGRPSMGKTTTAINIGYNAAMAFKRKLAVAGEPEEVLSGARTVIITLETSGKSLVRQNLIGRITGIPGVDLRNPDPYKYDVETLAEASRKASDYLARIPLSICDRPGATMSSIRRLLIEQQRKNGLGLAIIDYLGLIKHPDTKKPMVQQVTEFSAAFKALARELNIPMIVLSQLSRACEFRTDKRPQLSDLRESGALEQDGDVVLLVYRAQHYLEKAEPDQNDFQAYSEWVDKMESNRNKIEIICAKNRQGPLGTAKLYFDGALATISELERHASF